MDQRKINTLCWIHKDRRQMLPKKVTIYHYVTMRACAEQNSAPSKMRKFGIAIYGMLVGCLRLAPLKKDRLHKIETVVNSGALV